MPVYDFKCEHCGQRYELVMSMKDDVGRAKAACIKCGKVLKRVYSCPAVIVKGTLNQVLGNLSSNQTIINHDGQPIRLNFIDHGERSEIDQRSIGKQIPGARMDDKTGKMVVDVASNIRDPLGAIERSKKGCSVDKETLQVNTPYKTKKGKR